MSRELKFRVWSPSKNKFLGESSHYNDHYSFGEITKSLQVHKESSGEFIYSIEDAIVQQFTGLKDKNNQEIYEGDIIKQIDGGLKIRYGPVEWISELDGWDFTGWKMKHSTYGDRIERTEIIGNIYENPELLKDEV